MSSYGQFCPVAKAMEVLDERWTLLVVRELLAGSSHFNELRRGNPKMSPALLSKRLRTLERAGIVEQTMIGGRTGYQLTQCGKELGPVIDGLGAWGVRWIGELGEEDLDPHLLMWDLRRTLPIHAWPRDRTVVAFRFSDVTRKAASWWVVVAGTQADVCDYDPGFEVAATVTSDLRTMTDVWRGDLSWDRALRAGQVEIEAPTDIRKVVPEWIGQGDMAKVPRPA